MSTPKFERLAHPDQRVLWQRQMDGSESLYLLGFDDIAEPKTMFFCGPPALAKIVEAVARSAAEKATATRHPVVFSF